MYEEVLGDAELEALWAEYPEAFSVGELEERIEQLEEQLRKTEKQRDAYKECVETLNSTLDHLHDVAWLSHAIAKSRLSVEP